jgi:ribosomal 30S subunit maturation factor RimM
MSSKPHGTRHIVSFAGVDSREAADSLHGHVLYAEGLDSEGELYVHELIGSEVEDSTGRRLGRVSAVEANPASDLLVIEGKWYVPVRFVVEQGEGRIVVEIPDGLIE